MENPVVNEQEILHEMKAVMQCNSNFVSLLIPQAEMKEWHDHVDGLVEERHNSIANTLELCLSCTNPSILSTMENLILICSVEIEQLISIDKYTPPFCIMSHISVLKQAPVVPALKTESCHDANFVITGGTGGCHTDNLQCH